MTKEEIKQDILKALVGLKVSEAQELLQSLKVNLGDNVIMKAPVVKEVSIESKTKPFF